MKVYDYKLIKKFKVPAKEIKYLQMSDVKKLVNVPNPNTFTGLRMRAAILTGISTCLRISELLSLKKSDLNYETGIIAVRTKGNKPHRVIINEAAINAIKAYLAVRQDDNDHLFVTANKNSVSPWKINDCQRSLRKLGRKLGFKINVTPHLLFRRSVATHMFKEGVPLGVIQAALNHSSSSVTTRFYIGNMAFEEVIKHHNRVMNFDLHEN